MRKTHPDLPLAFNYSSSFRWHQDPHPIRFKELGELGYRFIFITLYGAHAAMYAVGNAMQDLAENEEAPGADQERAPDGKPSRDGPGGPFPGVGAPIRSRSG